MKGWGMGLRTGIVALVLAASTPGYAAERMIVFGDSLTDIGNDYLKTRDLIEGGAPLPFPVPPPSRYFEGRFSNGPVWIDYLARERGIHGALLPSEHPDADIGSDSIVYAYGGSGTYFENVTPGQFPVPGLLGQVADFTADLAAAGTTADPEALYVIWSGANDYLLADLGLPGIPEPDPRASVGNILDAIAELEAAGARHFLVLNLPNLAYVPAAALLDLQARVALLLRSKAHNSLLARGLRRHARYSTGGSTLDLVDTFALLGAIDRTHKALGFSQGFEDLGPAANCLVALDPATQSCAPLPDGLDSAGFPFWDEQHPATRLHQLVAFRASFCLDDPGNCRVE
jgi:phospholipase/lecithinase/hemolysin